MATKKNNNKSTETPKPARKTRKQDPEATAPVEPTNRPRGLTVVGIGASAGGLPILQTFFESLPNDTGMAFVVVTHLHPEHESHLAELLQKYTQMPTLQVNERVKVEPNHVYVIPPNRSISMDDSHLDIAEFNEPHGRRMPVDHFFRSLANGHSESIAVILSGGGTDGSVGIKDIKEDGGLILVQHPDDAEYDSMPRAAISTGLVDVVLPARQLAEKLVEYSKYRPQLPNDPGRLNEQELGSLQRILSQVHARTGHDFTQYKRSTILRRIERRMQLNGLLTLEAYLKYLRQNVNESQAMFNDILIGVTNFFRDRESWLALEQKVMPALFERKDDGNDIRIWSIGCATGEEAYSLAILAFEQAVRMDFRPRIQIFASDLDERSISHARSGLYPAAIEADVSPERLERFFTREGEYYRVKRELRDAVLFANHNVLRDPPFSRQDLIVCRNVMIYLQRDVQDKVFDIFHYALHPQGYLFLGSSESAETALELFSVVDKNHRLYRARPWVGDKPHVPTMPIAVLRDPRSPEPYTPSRPHPIRYAEAFTPIGTEHQKALEDYGPPSLIVNEKYAILHVSETAGRYLLQPKGPITGDLLTLVRPEMQLELRTALFRVFDKDRATISQLVSVQFNGHTRRVIVSVRPLPEAPGAGRRQERYALVFFLEDELDEPSKAKESGTNEPRSPVRQDHLVAQLEGEMQRLREKLQITTEEYDSSNEEMKAANEELQSINEEYRSATEELETSREELQSVNEELQTVNNEMRNKLDEISRAHVELENLMGATEIATLFLDRDLRIQRYTAGVKGLFNIIPIDRGRRISDLTHKLGYTQFMEDAEQVMRRLVLVEREVQIEGRQWFLIRMRPYRTVDDKIEGLAITFIEITQLKQIQEELERAKGLLEERVLERTRELNEANQNLSQARDLFYELFNANPIPTALTRLEDDVLLNVNTEFLAYFSLQDEDVIGHRLEKSNFSLYPEKQSRADFIARVKHEGKVRSYERQIQHASGETRNILTSVQYIILDQIDVLIFTFIDITDRVRAEQQIRSLASRLTEAEHQERHRISQVLHDDLQQRLFALKAQLSFLREEFENKDGQAFQNDLSDMEDGLAEAISITRNLSIDISPIILHGEGFVDAIGWLSNRMQEQYGLDVKIKTNGVNSKFSESLRVALFQAVRELFFNVVKHADTLEAEIEFEELDDHTRITVNDYGKGFNTHDIDSGQKGNGLISIRHRLNLLGCTLQVTSEPGNGTRAVIDCPKT